MGAGLFCNRNHATDIQVEPASRNWFGLSELVSFSNMFRLKFMEESSVQFLGQKVKLNLKYFL